MSIKSVGDIEREKRQEEIGKSMEDVGKMFNKNVQMFKDDRAKRKVEDRKKPKNRFLRGIGWALIISWGLIFGLFTVWLLKLLIKGVFGI